MGVCSVGNCGGDPQEKGLRDGAEILQTEFDPAVLFRSESAAKVRRDGWLDDPRVGKVKTKFSWESTREKSFSNAYWAVLDRFDQQRLLVIGDVILDEYLSGSAHRLSPEAPVPIVQVDDEEIVLGGSGNVAMNAMAMGAQCDWVGCDWK